RHQITRIAKQHFLREEKILRKIHVCKAYSAYQMTKLITEQLKILVNKINAKVIIISDISGLFLSEDISHEDAHLVYSQLVSYIQKFAQENHIVIVGFCPKHQNNTREKTLKEASLAKANVVLALRQTMYSCELELEKHYKYMLGVCDYSYAGATLTDFF
ncbi:MAG: hypothetical protein GX638_11050, partial [Crenarchaeota archaeon]|nr:hypothetical protein [Thermoproteota archaeon]